MTRAPKRFGHVLVFPPVGYVRDAAQMVAEDRERAAEMFPFPVAAIGKRRLELWVCKSPVPFHRPCTCWPAGMPTIEDAIADLTLEQLGLKGAGRKEGEGSPA